MKNGSELVVLAKEIHENILKNAENGDSICVFIKANDIEMCMEMVPEFIDESEDKYEISNGINSIHIKTKEVTHIEKIEDVVSTFYTIYYKNNDEVTFII